MSMEPFDFTHGGMEMGEGRKGGERRNGRNTRVWHKKNLDTGMRKAEGREKEQMPDCGTEPRAPSADGLGKSLQSDTGSCKL